jgi:hypothetical protein
MNNIDFHISHKEINPQKVDEVISGKLVGCLFRDCFSKKSCDTVLNNIKKQNIFTKQTNIDPHYLAAGTGHYQKKLEDYLKESKIQNSHLKNIFEGTENFYNNMIFTLKNYYLKKNIILRSAKHQNQESCKFIIRSFQNNHPYVIRPHDDLAQCCDKAQADFEIQKVKKSGDVIGLNLCLSNDFEGDLIIWQLNTKKSSNQQPSLESPGYNYPNSILKTLPKIKISIHPGDIYFLNANNIHAVASSDNNKTGTRTAISNFLAKIDRHTIVTWT